MTEDILVSVKGIHALDPSEKDDEVEIFSAGKYYFKNGKHYILYEEMAEDGSGVVKSRITLRDGCMEVQKKQSDDRRGSYGYERDGAGRTDRD